jgi:glycerol-3-phosphate dehydrogenase
VTAPSAGSASARVYDVAIIGGGVVGTAIARALSHHTLDIVLLEAGTDVGAGTSKSSTAILHTGFDATPGSLEARLVRRGYELLQAYAAETRIAVEATGAILVAWTDEQAASLPAIREKAAQNGVHDLLPLNASELYRAEPNLGRGALGGLRIPGESIVCPYSPPIAYATDALANGAELLLERPVIAVETGSECHVLRTPARSVRARFVVNAAGLQSDAIDAMFGNRRFTVRPRRGELIVYDKLARRLLNHVLLPVPTKTTKGVLVSPTVFGNVLLGPTADDIDDKSDTATTERGLASLLEKGKAILPALLAEEVTATYTGLRAATEHSDYQIHLDAVARYVCVGGIRSTGLSASLGIAEHVVGLLESAGLALQPKATVTRIRMPTIGETQQRPHAHPDMIARNPDYGRIVCHCERVSRAEICDALSSPLPARSLDALRRRTRCLQGRCQGFYCLAEVATLLSERSGLSILAVLGQEPGT